MTKTLIDELGGWRNKWYGGLTKGGVLVEFDEILSRHAEPKEDSLEAWENEAEAFYKATGYLRPGKDPGMIGDDGYCERRDKAWKIWSAGWCYRNDHPTPDKAVEPLAVLADRKGMCIVPQKFMGQWHIGVVTVGMKERHIEIEFKAPTYAAAEAKARQYLEALPDVKGGK